jgi:serine/threonine protein kinase
MDIERIGKYRVLEEIGRGMMGRVYKAHDPVLNRFVAIKTMSADIGKGDEMHKRFHREAQAAALLSHPNIVTIHDFGEEQGLIYMAMELLEGQDLRAAIDHRRLSTLDDKLRVMEQICSGLAFAHSKGVVHRDLKPANLHLQPNGQLKIVDFGLARLSTSDITQDGIVLGTPNYMSPEQALGDKVDARSDVFSAGAVCYEILTNRKPFEADSTPGVLYQVVHKDPPAIREWSPEVPRVVVDVVEKALVKDKNLRFQTARQMRAALSVARQAVDGGRGSDATLAEESQRALKDASERAGPLSRPGTDSDSGPGTRPGPRTGSGSGSGAGARRAARSGYVDGTIALDMNRPDPTPRPSTLPPTLSGQTPTQLDRGSGRRRAPVRAPTPHRFTMTAAALIGLTGLALAGLAVGGLFWLRTQPALAPAEPGAADARTEVLTRALVETQLKLASRDLEDKNYGGAVEQAERVLKLAPANTEARRLLKEARSRKASLDAAVVAAKKALEGGNTARASQELQRVLDLDPRHPAAGELTTRLNSVFKSRAEESARSMKQARTEAERAKAGPSDAFAQAAGVASDAEGLFAKGEYAEATRSFLESRDGFDRARRAIKAPLPTSATASAPETGPGRAALPAAPPASAATTSAEPAASAAPAVVRHFLGSKTTIATKSAGGDLAGFDTADVKKQRVPDFAGRVEFEATPAAVQAGESYAVRIYLVNESRKPVRVKAISVITTANGTKAPAAINPVTRDVAPQQRALLGEVGGEWPEGLSSWTLDAVVTTDRDETATSRLNWM